MEVKLTTIQKAFKVFLNPAIERPSVICSKVQVKIAFSRDRKRFLDFQITVFSETGSFVTAALLRYNPIQYKHAKLT